MMCEWGVRLLAVVLLYCIRFNEFLMQWSGRFCAVKSTSTNQRVAMKREEGEGRLTFLFASFSIIALDTVALDASVGAQFTGLGVLAWAHLAGAEGAALSVGWVAVVEAFAGL